jgi:hypothetical protein
MSRVEGNQIEFPRQDAIDELALGGLRRNLPVPRVSPPDNDVGPVQILRGKPLLGIVLGTGDF